MKNNLKEKWDKECEEAMKPNQIEKEILEKFDKKFNNIDVNECEYNDDGEPDNMVIIDSEGLRRNGLKSVRQFISDSLSTYRTQVEKENDVNIQNAYLKGIADGRKQIEECCMGGCGNVNCKHCK